MNKVARLTAVFLLTTSINGLAFADTTNPVAKILQGALKDLKSSKVPVYLPTWMPPANQIVVNGKVYANGFADSEGYSVSLSAYPGKDVPGASTAFYINGAKGANKTGRKVDLGNGKIGYMGDKYDNVPNIHWQTGKFEYTLGMMSGGDEKILLRVAKSVAKFAN